MNFVVPNGRIFAVELPAEIRERGTIARASIRRVSTGDEVAAFVYDDSVASFIPRMYLPIWARVAPGEALTFELTIEKGVLSVPLTEEGELLLGWVRTPVIPHSSRIDGKIFENVAVLPRHWPVWNVRRLSLDEMLKDRTIDFRTTAILTSESTQSLPQMSPVTGRQLTIRVTHYDGATTELTVDTKSSVLLATSEKITPDMRVSLDGSSVEPVEINGMFAGIPLTSGTHRITITRRIGRAYWPLSIVGLLLLGAASLVALRGRTTRMI